MHAPVVGKARMIRKLRGELELLSMAGIIGLRI